MVWDAVEGSTARRPSAQSGTLTVEVESEIDFDNEKLQEIIKTCFHWAGDINVESRESGGTAIQLIKRVTGNPEAASYEEHAVNIMRKFEASLELAQTLFTAKKQEEKKEAERLIPVVEKAVAMPSPNQKKKGN